MAGLSIVGGWFGGNAMLGSAILNGIALGLGGGGAAYASLTAIGKVGVLTSVTATALDGVLVYLPPDKKELVYRVRLPVPDRIGTRDVRNIVDDMNEIDSKLVKVGKKIETAKSEGYFAKKEELETEALELVELKSVMKRIALTEAKMALVEVRDGEDLLVLAILSKNMGEENTYSQLIRRIPTGSVSNRSYLDYLKAVAHIENGQLQEAIVSLRESRAGSRYAVEPALLLVNALGNGGIDQQEAEIRKVIERAEEDYERDDYASSYSLLAIYYRVAAMYFMGHRYGDALVYYQKAYDELPWMQKYIGSKQLKNVIRLGMANSLYRRGDRQAADELFEEVLEDAESDDEKTSCDRSTCRMSNRKRRAGAAVTLSLVAVAAVRCRRGGRLRLGRYVFRAGSYTKVGRLAVLHADDLKYATRAQNIDGLLMLAQAENRLASIDAVDALQLYKRYEPYRQRRRSAPDVPEGEIVRPGHVPHGRAEIEAARGGRPAKSGTEGWPGRSCGRRNYRALDGSVLSGLGMDEG